MRTDGLFRTICLSAALTVISAVAHANDVDLQDCVVRFAEEVQVPALETGRVVAVSVKLNEQITKGAPIARSDDHTLLIRRRSTLLRLNAAKNEIADDLEIRYAETALAEAEAELETNRSIQKSVAGAIPMSSLRQLRLAVERGGLEVARSKKRRKQALIEVELREADLAVQDDQLKSLQTNSPIDGIVVELTRSVGEWIEKGQPLATVARIDRLHVHALAASSTISPKLCRDMPVSVHWVDTATGKDQSLRGKVLSVDPQMLPGGRFRLHAEIVNEPDDRDNRQWKLTPGTDVRMKMYISVAGHAGRARY